MRYNKNKVIIGNVKCGKSFKSVIICCKIIAKRAYPFNVFARKRYYKELLYKYFNGF